MTLIKNIVALRRKSCLRFVLIISYRVFNLRILITVFCYGLTLLRILEYLAIGNKVAVVEVRDSIRLGITTIVVANIVANTMYNLVKENQL